MIRISHYFRIVKEESGFTRVKKFECCDSVQNKSGHFGQMPQGKYSGADFRNESAFCSSGSKKQPLPAKNDTNKSSDFLFFFCYSKATLSSFPELRKRKKERN